MMKERINFVEELWNISSYFFVAPAQYDEKTVKKRWKEDSARCMTEAFELLQSLKNFSSQEQEKTVMDWIVQKSYHTGDIMNAFRLAVVGESKGPHLFDITHVIGKEETLTRIKRAITELK
jgi:glutamyl-tRNA synthetase